MKHNYQSITEELFNLHDSLRKEWPGLCRIAVAIYDDETGYIHTFIKSSLDEALLNHYSAPLKEIPSLVSIAECNQPRLIQDLSILQDHNNVHSKAISHHFKSSYTEPFYLGDTLMGFVFYDADEVDYFSDELLENLDTYSRLVESLIISAILPLKTLVALMATTQEITNLRDSETGEHLVRMAHNMEIIARELAEQYDLTDEQIEYIWCYAPLHDIGKIVIPDSILLKPGKLTEAETKIMQTHVTEGIKMIDKMLGNFHFQDFHHTHLLKDIVGCHHEWYNGKGYPNGLKGEEIPIVGRIAAVADVFDALISDRVYRKGWPFEEVVKYLQAGKGKQFDPDCVDALLKNEAKIKALLKKCKDTAVKQ
ncbi:HD domain-containing protein [Thiomicrorhabdus hydrogeniphila]